MRSSLKQTNKTNPTPPPPHNKIKPGLEKKTVKTKIFIHWRKLCSHLWCCWPVLKKKKSSLRTKSEQNGCATQNSTLYLLCIAPLNWSRLNIWVLNTCIVLFQSLTGRRKQADRLTVSISDVPGTLQNIGSTGRNRPALQQRITYQIFLRRTAKEFLLTHNERRHCNCYWIPT